MRDDTIICRCEEVTYGQIREALEAGLTDIGDLRKYTRVGMGCCQGRTCERLLMQIVKQYCREKGIDMPKNDIHPRTPIQALSIESIAESE